MKVLVTGVIFRVLLNRRLMTGQWLCLALLACAAAMTQIKPSVVEDCTPSEVSRGGAELKAGLEAEALRYQGLVFAVIACCTSSFAGVYTEKLMKGDSDSIHFQNLKLYLWGVASNVAVLGYQGQLANLSNVFEGFNTAAYMVILIQASNGLVVSWLLKVRDLTDA